MKNTVFFCDWHTRVSPGATYYTGCKKVSVNHDGDETLEELQDMAATLAQNTIWRDGFQDYGRNHIIVWNVRDARAYRK